MQHDIRCNMKFVALANCIMMCNKTNIGLCLFVQKLSDQCDFADTLDHMLRDRLVCGIRDVRVQRRLLAERLRKPMTWTKRRRQPRKALNICISNNRLTLFTPSRTLRTRPDNNNSVLLSLRWKACNQGLSATNICQK